MPCATRAAMPSWWNAWPRCAPTTDAIRRASQKHGGCLRCRRPYSDFQTAGENPMSDEDIHAAGMKVRRRILDRKSVVEGTSVSVRVDLGGRRIIKKKHRSK